MNHNINKENITLANGYSLDFEYPIKQALTIDDVIIILIDGPPEANYDLNVFAIRLAGDFLWRIGKVALLSPLTNDCRYVGITINMEKELVLFNWCDTAVIVNPNTGDVIRTYETR